MKKIFLATLFFLVGTLSLADQNSKVVIIFSNKLYCAEAKNKIGKLEISLVCIDSKKSEKVVAYNGIYYGKDPWHLVLKKVKKNRSIEMIRQAKVHLLKK